MTNGNDRCANCGGDRAIHHYQTDQCPVGGVESPLGRDQEWKASAFGPIVIPFDPPNRLASDMTIREHFAAMAMQGLLSDAATIADIEKCGVPLNQVAVIHADALIEALNKETL